ncbi:MAG: competence/damage-inducible protein A [Acidobacteria bacterium]|nr:competence/damage-inducible protein A [Acidobacteriota bacterium]
MNQTTAAILIIGDEILSGKTEEKNAKFLISELRDLGVSLRLITVVPDDIDQIGTTLSDLSKRFTYVFTSGGVGPTHDDVTLLGVCKAFNTKMHRHPEIELALRNYFGDKLQETHLRMAEVPQGSIFIKVAELRWPILSYQNVYIFPGVPEFFKQKFTAIKERFRASEFYLKLIFTKQDEFDIADHLTQVAKDYAQVSIGSYPVFDREDYKVKVTIESKDSQATESAFNMLISLFDKNQIVRSE